MYILVFGNINAYIICIVLNNTNILYNSNTKETGGNKDVLEQKKKKSKTRW